MGAMLVDRQTLNVRALGMDAVEIGTASLPSDSFNSPLISCNCGPSAKMLPKGLSAIPRPANPGRSILVMSPMGTSVLDWARNLPRVSTGGPDGRLNAIGNMPSPVLVIVYLSRPILYC
jgi:hypothetical protein